MAKIIVNVQKRLKGASAEAEFWYGDNIDHVERKKLKIASFTEAPFMVKFDFIPRIYALFLFEFRIHA